MSKRSTTTKDIGLLRELHDTDQLKLAPEFQRNAVWPRDAKAYLIDTILCERPMPLFFFQRGRSAQTGKPIYSVVDGQQRLRAIFEYMDDRFKLTQSKARAWKGRRFSELSQSVRENLLNYDITIEELTGYSESDIRDIFVRMNKYVVKLSSQELRHAREAGAFYDFVEHIAKNEFWTKNGIISKQQHKRMRAAEFAAELIILLVEGPQDKKQSLDLYYGEYKNKFPAASAIRKRLEEYQRWILAALPDLRQTRFRRPTDFYGLVGAIERISRGGKKLASLNPVRCGEALRRFEVETHRKKMSREAAAYLIAASRQTDNITPRTARIEILARVLR